MSGATKPLKPCNIVLPFISTGPHISQNAAFNPSLKKYSWAINCRRNAKFSQSCPSATYVCKSVPSCAKNTFVLLKEIVSKCASPMCIFEYAQPVCACNIPCIVVGRCCCFWIHARKQYEGACSLRHALYRCIKLMFCLPVLFRLAVPVVGRISDGLFRLHPKDKSAVSRSLLPLVPLDNVCMFDVLLLLRCGL